MKGKKQKMLSKLLKGSISIEDYDMQKYFQDEALMFDPDFDIHMEGIVDAEPDVIYDWKKKTFIMDQLITDAHFKHDDSLVGLSMFYSQADLDE